MTIRGYRPTASRTQPGRTSVGRRRLVRTKRRVLRLPVMRTVGTQLNALAINGAGHPADLACMLAELCLTLDLSVQSTVKQKGMASHSTDMILL